MYKLLFSEVHSVHQKLLSLSILFNFYWMEGPMPGDPGRRIKVFHQGQAQQCSNCFKTANSGCKGAGNGRACLMSGGQRAKMSVYMESLKVMSH